ncbi:MAG: hypothetical protein AABZ60_17980 [Planctomycetota bacterium]
MRSICFLIFLGTVYFFSGCDSPAHLAESFQTSNIPGTLVLIDNQGLSSSSLSLPQNGVLYFCNRHPSEPISVEVQLQPNSSVNGETTLGFKEKNNVYFTSHLIAPGAMATLSITTPGKFPFRVHGLGRILEGEIVIH